ncbi:hypothetical protein C1M51_06175 [Methylibium sp. Pch-M]|uniref:NifU family protein n=1 Tax=Methylibium sp. Pch-M TaxID=2082386 RepID=UPI0010108B1A|nr:NifU family protein [Methylibium sp. Pch-M]QAZ39054.1 hypothetical protein C1M51_06175 [Methylibium sp. Pch-M]
MSDTDVLHTQSAAELARRAGELASLEALTQGWDEAQQRVLAAIKSGIEDLNAEAFRRLIRALKDDPAAAPLLHRAVRDPLVYQVLRFHGVVKAPLEERVARALDEVRPFLATHGGDVELVAVRPPDTVEVRLVGACQSCPSSGETLSEGVEKSIRAHCPEIRTVARVSRGAAEHSTGAKNGAQVLHFVSPFARPHDSGWEDLCRLDELRDGDIVTRAAEGRELLLYRHGDSVACYDNACAHLGMPLDGGVVESGRLHCPHHGFAYRLDTGECLTVPEVQLAVHAVKVVGERVFVRVRR